MTAKYDDFMAELEVLCKKHQVQISVSDYDGIQIWDLNERDEIIHSYGIEDMTKGSPLRPKLVL